MPYSTIIEDELAIMEERLNQPAKSLRPQEIQVPLGGIMHKPFIVESGTSVQTAVDLMANRDIGYVTVASGEKLIGIFGERDIIRDILETASLDELPVDVFMKRDPKTLKTDDQLDTAIIAMAEGGYRHIPIIDDEDRPVGMVSVRHLITYLVEHFPQEVLTLPLRPIKHAMKAREGA